MVFARYTLGGTVHVHGHPKLLVVKWLGLNVTVKVRVWTRDREWIF